MSRFLKRHFLPWLLCVLAVILCPTSAWAAKNLKVTGTAFNQHVLPSENVTFTVTVQNNEPTNEGAELVIISTNQETGVETVLADVGSGAGNVPANGGTFTFTETVGVQAAGRYTMTFRILDGDALRSDQLNAKFPLHVGTEEESLRVFPEVIHFGTIPPGRYLHPMPIEIRWSFFRFNRLRKDQPFSIRIYTDNAARYEGIPHALGKTSPAGLVSLNGRYVIPIKCWTINFGPDIQETGWDAAIAGPPPVDDDDYWLGPPLIEGTRSYGSANWVRIPDLVDMTPNPITWRRLIGQDQYDSRFVADANVTGDFTLKSPFTLYLATEAGPTAVEGSYVANLVVELWAP